MVQIAVAELKATLSQQLRRVKAGDEVTITERGVPIARIVPVARASFDLDSVQDLLADGTARPPLSPLPAEFWATTPTGSPTGVLAALLLEREQGW